MLIVLIWIDKQKSSQASKLSYYRNSGQRPTQRWKVLSWATNPITQQRKLRNYWFRCWKQNIANDRKVRIMRMQERENYEDARMGEWFADQSCKPPSLLSLAMNQPGASFTHLTGWTWKTSLSIWLVDWWTHLANQKTLLLISLNSH